MLSKRDQSGGRIVARHALVFTLILVTMTTVPGLYHHAEIYYWLPTTLLNLMMLTLSIRFFIADDRKIAARRLFFGTLIYLPLFLAALVAGTKF